MDTRFVMGVEAEFLTAPPPGMSPATAAVAFLKEMASLAPSLPCSGGFFNSYGRVYLDGEHCEFATAECADPFTLASIMERLEALAGRALRRLRKRGIELVLANCNHSGILACDSPSWGTHVNMLCPVPPQHLTDWMLPYLSTMPFLGAGGIVHPSGCFVGNTRILVLDHESGGATTRERALFSTARNEPLTSTPSNGYRLHLINFDGVRSHFSRLLQVGVTALVVKAVCSLLKGDPSCNPKRERGETPTAFDCPPPLAHASGLDAQQAVNRCQTLCLEFSPMVPTNREDGFWIGAARTLNRLEIVDGYPVVDPMCVRIQRIYLELVDRTLAQGSWPAWCRQVAAIYEATLAAIERNDNDWLSQRLDVWIKWECIQSWMRDRDMTWSEATRSPDALCGLALFNQAYHEIWNPDSPFNQLERAGVLKHRVTPRIEPGSDPEPFVPTECATRAVPRARFIKEHHHERDSFGIDWTTAIDFETRRVWRWDDPFAGGISGK